MKRIRKWVYQGIANWIINMAKNAKTNTDFGVWFNWGMKFNHFCIKRRIELR